MQPASSQQFIRRFAVCLVLALLGACQSTKPTTNLESPLPQSLVGPPQLVLQPPAATGELHPIISDQSEIEVSYDDVWERMRAGFQLAAHYDHSAVLEQVTAYTGNQRYFDLVTQRASPFLHWIVEEIDRRQLPQELALLPIVESAFNPNAYSREHAVGLWQFMGATGSSFGLQQDWWYDGRRDPRASTLAALDYLEQLYKQFDEDWLLALAAYNTGDGNLRRAIRRRGGKSATVDFFALPLSRETRTHVPKILALAIVISNSENFGIELAQIPNQEALAVVEIGAQIDIAQAASLAQLDYDELRALNPGYLQWATHPHAPQHIVVPKAKAEILIAALAGIKPDQLVTWDRYEILPGDTLGGIASKLGSTVDILQTVNQLPGSRIIAGDSLLIPRSSDSALLASLPVVKRRGAPKIRVPSRYSVRHGDNLWSIARRYDIKSRDIARWNGVELDALLQPGQMLNLEFANAGENVPIETLLTSDMAIYIVRRGDSMAKIARRFNAALDDLLVLNQMVISAVIYPGQQIKISPTEPGMPTL